jgi:O-antigen/teichoic acid export membrane protein
MRVLGAFFANVLFNFVVGLLVAKFLGPEEYGRFALSLATALTVQAAFLDWLKLGATRFYSERSRGEDPALRATLDVAFTLVTAGLAVGTCLMFLAGVHFALSNALIALAMGVTVSNGLFDYNTALVRARFHDRLYVKLILVKNILALLLTGSGAYVFGSAKMALIGGIISISGSVVAARTALSDPGAEAQLARFDIAKTVLRYTLPIVTANLLYLCIPLANRSLITIFYGFSETGQFSLAFDIGTKAIQAIGSTLDVLLFQIAVRAHESHGDEHAKQRIADNMAIMIAILLPACTGIWLVLPSLEVLIVPQQYRGQFGQLLTLMMPGLFFFALILYAINPIFQIAKRTGPLIAAAVVGCLADPLLLLALPRGHDASSLAIAQSGAYFIAFLVLTATANLSKPVWPRLRDLIAVALACTAMIMLVLPLRADPPSLATFLKQILIGAGTYAGLCALFDIATLRTLCIGQLKPVMTRLRTS